MVDDQHERQEQAVALLTARLRQDADAFEALMRDLPAGPDHVPDEVHGDLLARLVAMTHLAARLVVQAAATSALPMDPLTYWTAFATALAEDEAG
jgi:hypothetical protein